MLSKVGLFIHLFSFFSFLTSYSQSLTLNPERVENIKAATVRISIDSSGEMGTGFFMNERGYVVTCWHVIEGAIVLDGPNSRFRRIFIEKSSGQILEAAILGVFFSDTTLNHQAVSNDFCMLRLINSRGKTAFLNMDDFDVAKEGEAVYTCGYPLGLKQQFVSSGYISTKYIDSTHSLLTKNGPQKVYLPVALLDMTLNRGNSGGPIVRMGLTPKEDRVIGMADFVIIPIGNKADSLANALREMSKSSDAILNGLHLTGMFADIISVLSSMSNGISGCVSLNPLIFSLRQIN